MSETTSAAFPHPAFPLTPWRPLVINAALTGIATTRVQTPHVPLTTEEIVADAVRCVDAGARVLHLHARDADGGPAHGRDRYAPLVEAVRDACPNAVICVTTSGRASPDLAARLAAVDLGGDRTPELASLTLGSLNFGSGPSTNAIAAVEELARGIRDAGVRPEFEIFDLGMVHLLHRLIDRGLAEPPFAVNLLMGFPNSAPANAQSVVALIQALPPHSVWSLAGLGAYQRPMAALAAAMGGGIRTGLEDNPYLDHETRAPARNVELVREAADFGRAVGRPVATPSDARALLGLAQPSIAG